MVGENSDVRFTVDYAESERAIKSGVDGAMLVDGRDEARLRQLLSQFVAQRLCFLGRSPNLGVSGKSVGMNTSVKEQCAVFHASFHQMFGADQIDEGIRTRTN